VEGSRSEKDRGSTHKEKLIETSSYCPRSAENRVCPIRRPVLEEGRAFTRGQLNQEVYNHGTEEALKQKKIGTHDWRRRNFLTEGQLVSNGKNIEAQSTGHTEKERKPQKDPPIPKTGGVKKEKKSKGRSKSPPLSPTNKVNSEILQRGTDYLKGFFRLQEKRWGRRKESCFGGEGEGEILPSIKEKPSLMCSIPRSLH